MRPFSPSDIVASVVLPLGGWLVINVDQILSRVSLTLGIAYLLWKWNRERKTKPKG